MKRNYPLAGPLLCLLLWLASQPVYAQATRELLDKEWRYTDSPEAGVHYWLITKNRENHLRGLVMHFYGPDSVRLRGNLDGASYEGECTLFYPNGQMEARGTYAADARVGLWEEWYPNGRLRERGNYLETGEKYNFTRLPKTEYVIESFWDSTGTQLVKDGTGTYATLDGARVREKGQFENGKKTGTWLGFREDGKPFFEETYAGGKLVAGVSRDENGRQFTYGEADQVQMPAFKGGLEALQRYLQKNLKYPSEARQRKVQGFVFIRFTIKPSGALTNIGLFTKGPHIALENEAIRVVQAMPDWIPGTQHGQPVKVDYVLPIRFVF